MKKASQTYTCNRMHAKDIIVGSLIGGAIMYLYDPMTGRRRRERAKQLVEQKVVDLEHVTNETMARTKHSGERLTDKVNEWKDQASHLMHENYEGARYETKAGIETASERVAAGMHASADKLNEHGEDIEKRAEDMEH